MPSVSASSVQPFRDERLQQLAAATGDFRGEFAIAKARAGNPR